MKIEQKNNIKLYITGALILVLVFAVHNAFSRVKKSRRLKQETLTDEKVAKEKSAQEALLEKKEQKEDKELYQQLDAESKNLKVKRDPFVPSPVSYSEDSLSDLHLSGIVWDAENPKAIINDIIVGKGEQIGGSVVIDIKQDRVILYNGNSYSELKVGR